MHEARARLAALATDDVPDAIPVAPPRVGALKDMDNANVPLQTKPVATVAHEMGLLDHSSQLSELTGLALLRAKDILQEMPNPASDTYGDDLRAVTSTIKTTFTTQLRADENQLRRKVADALPALLKLVAAEEQKLQPQQIEA